MKTTTSFDTYLGKKIEYLRILKGYTRKSLAERLGITQQQLQKYEKGRNRVSAARLYEISQILDVTMHSLLDNKSSVRISKKDKILEDIMSLISKIKDRSKLLSLKNIIIAFVSRA